MRALILFSFIVGITSSLDLKCTSLRGDFVNVGNIKYCHVQNLVTTSPSDTVTSVDGQTTPIDYEGLFFNTKTVHYLPKGLAKFFPNLRGLSCHNGLKALQQSDLQGFKDLEVLYLYRTEIESLDGDLLKFNQKLHHVTVLENKMLKQVGKKILNGLNNLEKVDFLSNGCINRKATSDFTSFFKSIDKKCTDPEDLKRAYCSDEVDRLQSEINRLKTENDFLRRTHCDGLLDAATQHLHKVSKKLEGCNKTEAKTNTALPTENDDIIFRILNNTEPAIVTHLKIGTPGSNIGRIIDESGKDFNVTQSELVIDNQETLFLPTNLGQMFPKLLRLLITYSGLYEIGVGSFSGMENLLLLNLTHNKLVEVTIGMFSELKALTEIDLSHNNIEVLDVESFKENINLEVMKLNHNKLTAINGSPFGNLKTLKVLLLNNNRLKFITSTLIAHSQVLTSVDLSGNTCIDSSHPNSTLNEIEAELLDKCMEPVEIECKAQDYDSKYQEFVAKANESYCAVDSLAVNNPKTRILKVKNKISSEVKGIAIVDQSMWFIPFEISKTLPNLVELIVERSSLTTLFKTDFKGLVLLKDIIILGNNITLIEEGVFDEVPQLIHLNLASNNIKALPSKAFAKLSKLKILNLSDNHLKMFSASLVPRKNVIESLQLQKNDLAVIETKILKYLKKVEAIDFSENDCIDSKYVKSGGSGKNYMEIFAEIELNCSEDSVEDDQ